MRGNAFQIAARYRRIAQQIPRELQAMDRKTADEAKRIAEQLSSGEFRARRGDHPFAKRRPHPPGAAFIINQQTGRFKRSWRVKALGSPVSGQITHSLSNLAPYSGAFRKEGTRFMIGRDIMGEVARQIRPKRLPEADKALVKALRTP